jgi:pilus assembly protein CpaF
MFLRVSKDSSAKSLRPVANDTQANARMSEGHAGSVSDQDLYKSTEITELKMLLHQRLLEMINLSVIDKMAPEEFQKEIGEMVRELLLEENRPMNLTEQNQLIDDILDELLGLGPIEPLLKDPTVTDILANTHAQIFVEREGRLHLTPAHFKDGSSRRWDGASTNLSPWLMRGWPTVRA